MRQKREEYILIDCPGTIKNRGKNLRKISNTMKER
jgi:hypothetical protein